jgi:hypothetical protein
MACSILLMLGILILIEAPIVSGNVAGDVANTLGLKCVLNNSVQEGSVSQEAPPRPAAGVAKAKGPDLICSPANTIESEIFQVTVRLSMQVVAHTQQEEQAGPGGSESR